MIVDRYGGIKNVLRSETQISKLVIPFLQGICD